MSQAQAKYLCTAARDTIEAGIVQGSALAFPSANATLLIAAGYLGGASNELGGDANLIGLSNEVAAKASEIMFFIAIPWPFVYAAIAPWANALRDIKSRIPDIVILEPVRARAPVSGIPLALPSGPLAPGPHFGATFSATPLVHTGKGPKGYTRSDDRIHEDVSECLSMDPLVDASAMEVTVSEGKVALTGRATDRAAKRRAEDLALSVRGVLDVRNDLQTVA